MTSRINKEKGLTHVNLKGEINMVDIAEKDFSDRTAVAQGRIKLSKQAFDLLQSNSIKKGDVLTTAKIASIQAAKKTSELIPLCHQLNLKKIETELILEPEKLSVYANCKVKCNYQTGVEMEALTAVSVALLTIYDMCKSVDKKMKIFDIKLVSKTK